MREMRHSPDVEKKVGAPRPKREELQWGLLLRELNQLELVLCSKQPEKQDGARMRERKPLEPNSTEVLKLPTLAGEGASVDLSSIDQGGN